MTPRTLLVVVSVAVGLWLAWGAWSSPERAIARQLEELAELGTKSPFESELEGAGRARKIADLFAGEFLLEAEPEGYATSNRQDLIRAILAYRSRSRSLVVSLGPMEVLLEGKEHARVFATVTFVNDLGDLAGTELYPVEARMVREAGEWRIRRLELRELD